jgi:hypothetical protein
MEPDLVARLRKFAERLDRVPTAYRTDEVQNIVDEAADAIDALQAQNDLDTGLSDRLRLGAENGRLAAELERLTVALRKTTNAAWAVYRSLREPIENIAERDAWRRLCAQLNENDRRTGEPGMSDPRVEAADGFHRARVRSILDAAADDHAGQTTATVTVTHDSEIGRVTRERDRALAALAELMALVEKTWVNADNRIAWSRSLVAAAARAVLAELGEGTPRGS